MRGLVHIGGVIDAFFEKIDDLVEQGADSSRIKIELNAWMRGNRGSKMDVWGGWLD